MSKSTKKSRSEINLPGLVTARDYHDFPVIQDQLNQLAARGEVVKVVELGLDAQSAMYVGLVYAKGSKPGKSDVKFMVSSRGYELLD